MTTEVIGESLRRNYFSRPAGNHRIGSRPRASQTAIDRFPPLPPHVLSLLGQARDLLRLSEALQARDMRHTLVQLVGVWRGETVKALDA